MQGISLRLFVLPIYNFIDREVQQLFLGCFVTVMVLNTESTGDIAMVLARWVLSVALLAVQHAVQLLTCALMSLHHLTLINTSLVCLISTEKFSRRLEIMFIPWQRQVLCIAVHLAILITRRLWVWLFLQGAENLFKHLLLTVNLHVGLDVSLFRTILAHWDRHLCQFGNRFLQRWLLDLFGYWC